MKKIASLLFLWASFSAQAQLVDKTGEVDIVKSRQQFNRAARTINVPVTITNTSDITLLGEQRLVILNPSIPLSSFDGVDDNEVPYILTPSLSLLPGESTSIAVRFQLVRSRLTFDTLFFVDVEEPVPAEPLINELVFNDQSLAQCVQSTTSSNNITLVSELTVLDCSNTVISNLSGIEQLTSLSELNISQTLVTDLSDLFELESLTIVNLDRLILSDQLQANQLMESGVDVIGRIDVLLNTLTFNDPALQACVERESSINGQQLVSELTFLACFESPISDLSGVEELTGLTILELIPVPGLDLSSITQLPNLNEFSVSGEAFNNDSLTQIVGSSSLTSLSLFGTSVSNFRLLAANPNISSLRLALSELDVEPLAEVPSLRRLELDEVRLTNFSAIGQLTQLTELRIFNEDFLPQQDVDIVYELTDLRRVTFPRRERLNDDSLLELVEALPNLEELRLEDSFVSDLSIVTRLSNLRELSINRLNIDDLSALFTESNVSNGPIPSLSFIDIDDIAVIPGSDSGLVEQVEALRANPQVFVAGELAFGQLISDFIATLDNEPLQECVAAAAESFRSLVTEQVRSLFCNSSELSDLTGLGGLTNLQSVFISFTNVTDLTPILELPNLQSVNIDNLLLDDPNQVELLRDRGVFIFGELASGERLIDFVDGIPDPELRACILERARFERTVEDVTFLNCEGFAITDLTGLEAFTNLESLTLRNTGVTDLTPILALSSLQFLDIEGLVLNDGSQLDVLRERGIDVQGNVGVLLSSLTFADPALESCVQQEVSFNGQRLVSELTTLSCFDEALVDLTGVEQLTALAFLRLGFTSVTDFSPVTELLNLNQFDVSGASFSNEGLLAVINAPSLMSLSLDSTSVTDLSLLLSNENLNSLSVNSMDVDIAPLTELTSLRSLSLFWSIPFNFSDLGRLTQLTNLSVFNGPLSAEQIDIIYQLSNLRRFDVQRALPVDDAGLIELVESLPNLEVLDLSDSQVSNLDVASVLVNLREVQLRNTPVEDISGLFVDSEITNSPLPNLSFLGIDNVPVLPGADNSLVEQIDALRLSPQVFVFGDLVFGDLISDFVDLIADEGLRNCILDNTSGLLVTGQITGLFCDFRNISDLSGIEQLTNLQSVFIGNNNVSDLTPLLDLPNLFSVGVENLVLDDPSQVDVLRDRGVNVFGELVSGDLLSDFLDTIVDDELRACIENNTNGLRTVEQVTFLNCQGFAVTDLTGLEAFTNLESLTLRNTSVTDLTPILGLPGLQFLDIEGLVLDDESQLDTLRERGIDVQGNVGVLLSSLTFADPALEACVQQEISFGGQRLVSELTFLSCFDGTLVDLTGLEQLTGLSFLELGFTSVTDFSLVNGLPNLSQFRVQGETFTNDSLEQIINESTIQTFAISGTSVSDLSLLIQSSSLRRIEFGAGSYDISPLASLISLRELSFFTSDLTDFSALGTLEQLTSLSIFGDVLSQEQVDVVYQLSNLRSLSIDREIPLDDIALIELIEALPNIEVLDLSNSLVSNLDAASALINLSQVSLGNTPVSDINGLFIDGELTNGPIPSLTFLDVSNVPVLPDSNNNLIEQVEALRLNPQVLVIGELVFGELLSDFIPSLNDEALQVCLLSNTEGLVLTGQVTSLFCSSTGILDLSGVEQLINLEQVFIDNTNVSDLGPIIDLPKLLFVGINNLILVEPSQLDVLRDRGVNVFGELLSGELLSDFLDTIVDDGLRACIVNNTQGLRVIEEVTFLNCQGFAVTDLTGLEAFTNLESLTLRNTQVTNLSAVLDLPALQFIDVEGLILEDAGQLDALRERGIDVQGNLGVLLSSLTFADPALEACIQQEVSFNGQELVSELTFLSCFDSVLADLSGIGQLTSLGFLELGFTSVVDFSPVTQIPNLGQLNILGTTFTDESLSQVVTIPTLRTLSLDSTSVTDLSLLVPSANLSNLFLSFMNIDISPLAELPLLRNLALSNSFPTNFLDVANLTQLTNLSVFNGPLQAEQIDIIYQLSNLRRLDIQRALPLDNSSLLELVNALPNLESLNLSDSQVTNLNAVTGLASLNDVVLNRTPIEDISALFVGGDIANAPIPSLRFIDITGVPVFSDTSDLVAQVDALRSNPQVFVSGELTFGELISDFVGSLSDEALGACIINNSSGLVVTGQIRFLSCGFTTVSDLSGVELLSNLENIFIENTNVTDLTPILALPNLVNVGIENLTLDDPGQIDVLRNRGVTVFDNQDSIPVD